MAEAEARLAEAVTEAEACLAEVAGSEHVRTAGTERSRHLINAHTCQSHTERPKRSRLVGLVSPTAGSMRQSSRQPPDCHKQPHQEAKNKFSSLMRFEYCIPGRPANRNRS